MHQLLTEGREFITGRMGSVQAKRENDFVTGWMHTGGALRDAMQNAQN